MARHSRIMMIFVAAMLAACASNDFVSSWKAPDAVPLQASGAKVAAIVMMDEAGSRRAAEDALARELTAHGAEGVALYTIAPDVRPDNEATVRSALARAGVAGAVVMRPVSTTTEVESTPITYAGPAYSGFWGGYYGYGWGSPYGAGVMMGGDIRTNTIVSIETLVYSLPQNKLVWGGQSKTTNPSGVERLIKDTVSKVVKELERQGLIPG